MPSPSAAHVKHVSYDDAMETLEAEGVEKFTTSWDELLELVSAALPAARSSAEPSGTGPAT